LFFYLQLYIAVLNSAMLTTSAFLKPRLVIQMWVTKAL